MNIALVAFVSYLIGSIPFGVVLARLFRLPDPRSIGSGNIGATNMLRTGNKKVALLTLLLDAGKGALAVFFAYLYVAANDHIIMAEMNGHPTYLPALALTAAAIGHMATLWLKFTGGKGVATILGGALALSGCVGLSACAIWLAIYLLTRYVSLASVMMLGLLPVVVGISIDWASAAIVAIACAYAIYKHRSNIARLRRGEEPKMRLGKSA